MTPSEARQDLIVLAADLSMQKVLQELLQRHESLRIREISCQVIVASYRDPAVLRSASEILQSSSGCYRYALAVCDRHGCGKDELSRERLEAEIETMLANHWRDRAAAIVIDPELEVWVWADSPHVAQAIRWPGGMPALRTWLQCKGFVPESGAKPTKPKDAYEKALKFTKTRKSSSIFQELAAKVTLDRCIDPAFVKLKSTLQCWFPPPHPPSDPAL